MTAHTGFGFRMHQFERKLHAHLAAGERGNTHTGAIRRVSGCVRAYVRTWIPEV